MRGIALGAYPINPRDCGVHSRKRSLSGSDVLCSNAGHGEWQPPRARESGRRCSASHTATLSRQLRATGTFTIRVKARYGITQTT